MKIKKKLRRGLARKNITGKTGKVLTEFVMISICAILAITISITSKILDVSESGEIYAASDDNGVTNGETVENADDSYDLSDVFSSVSESVEGNRKIKRIGTSYEDVVVGQRVQTVPKENLGINISESMEEAVALMDRTVTTLSASPDIMSDEDYET